MYSASFFASSSVTLFGGISIPPHLPLLPFTMLVTIWAGASFSPLYLPAISLKDGPTIFVSTSWQARQPLARAMLRSAVAGSATAVTRAAERVRNMRCFICRSFRDLERGAAVLETSNARERSRMAGAYGLHGPGMAA